MSDIRQFATDGVASRPPPKRIMRPCDYSLLRAIASLEMQVGTVEAYNRLCDAADILKTTIDSGNAKSQMTMFAIDPKWIYPVIDSLKGE